MDGFKCIDECAHKQMCPITFLPVKSQKNSYTSPRRPQKLKPELGHSFLPLNLKTLCITSFAAFTDYINYSELTFAWLCCLWQVFLISRNICQCREQKHAKLLVHQCIFFSLFVILRCEMIHPGADEASVPLSCMAQPGL